MARTAYLIGALGAALTLGACGDNNTTQHNRSVVHYTTAKNGAHAYNHVFFQKRGPTRTLRNATGRIESAKDPNSMSVAYNCRRRGKMFGRIYCKLIVDNGANGLDATDPQDMVGLRTYSLTWKKPRTSSLKPVSSLSQEEQKEVSKQLDTQVNIAHKALVNNGYRPFRFDYE